jgi:hypothetical protein
MRGGLFNPITDLQLVIASLPAHYERDIRWTQKPGARTVLLSPNRLTVNIGNQGYKLDSQIELDLNIAANWDSISPSDYTVAANRAGKDFYIYACQPVSGTAPKILLSANSTVPSGYNANNSRKIGGFHCLCVGVNHASTLTAWAPNTSISIGVTRRATTWDGYLYRCITAGTTGTAEPTWSNYSVGQTITDGSVTWLKESHSLEGYEAGDILPASIWDLKHRPVSNPEGMVYSEAANIWVDIYLQSGTGANTASVFGATITDNRNWMDFVDDAGAVRKTLLSDIEFQLIAAGSNEETNIAGSADPGTTGGHVDIAGRRMISNIGCEDCCGVMWQWLRDQSFRVEANHTHTENTAATYTQNATTAATDFAVWRWYDLPGAKGSLYRQGAFGDVKLRAGAAWTDGASSGSRSRDAAGYRWYAAAAIGCRLHAEPLRA